MRFSAVRFRGELSEFPRNLAIFGGGFSESGTLADSMAERVGFELEPFCGREQRGSPQAKSRAQPRDPILANGGGMSHKRTLSPPGNREKYREFSVFGPTQQAAEPI